jgi:hypothetical protein
MSSAQLIQTQSPAPGQSVSVWKEPTADDLNFCYRKIWQSHPGPTSKAWLSWAHHEHLLLTLLAHRDAKHVVQVAGLQVHTESVEVVTVDAGLDLQRHWLDLAASQGIALLTQQADALKLARACLKALQAIHALGVMHGDFKSDNLCIKACAADAQSPIGMDLDSLRLIDFAYAVYREQPLKFVLPIDPDRLDYMPDQYRSAIRSAQANDDPSCISRAACAQVDLYGLWHMLTKLVPASSGDAQWTAWNNWLGDCKLAVMKSLPASRPFDELTANLLESTEHLLIALDQPKAGWGQIRTGLRTMNAVAGTTPLISTQQTPMLTPLVSLQIPAKTLNAVKKEPLEPEAEQPVSLQSEAPAIRSTWRNLWQFHRWWLIVSLLALTFVWIDARFVQAGLQLSDWDFGWGLVAMLLAVPAVLGALVHAYSRSGTSRTWVRYSGLVLCAIAVHFLVLLFPSGVPLVFLVALLVLMSLFIAALLF